MIKPIWNELPEYYKKYVKNVIDKDIIRYLEQQKDSAVEFFNEIGVEKSLYRYEENKWSIKEILGHLCDTERIFVTRALQFARNEKQSLPGFEQDDYIAAANFDEVPLDVLVDDFVKMRESNLSLFGTFNDEIFSHKGTANDFEFTVASALFIIAGHFDHHINVIKEKYL